jgi:hypothetical protein
VKITMPHGSGYDWDGHIVGWAPGAVVEIDDSNEKAVAWARAWLDTGAELVEDAQAAPPPEPSLADLKAQAEALNLPTYGTKAQLQERIADANASE